MQDPANLRLFLKYGWKKKYVRFLLEREERGHLPRFSDFFNKTAVPWIEGLQKLAGVTDEERLTIEHEELKKPLPAGFKLVPIKRFPTPMGVIMAVKSADQRAMLERLYPEYEFLCSFAHGSSESVVSKTVLDSRSPLQRVLTSSQVEDFFQREVGENAVIYSLISVVQAATEIAAFYPGDVDLMARVTEAWSWLIKGTLLATPIWERRAKKLLPLVRV